MHSHEHRHGRRCSESQSGSQGSGGQSPAWLYGYCHESGRMRMMNYPDYVNSMQTTYSNLANPASIAQQIANMMQGAYGASPMSGGYGGYGSSQPGYAPQQSSYGFGAHGKGCGCRECREHRDCHDRDDDCDCSCHIRCADAVEYARCGEVRLIPLTFENETRRDRPVTLTLGAFATESGHEMGWQASLSDTTFTLAACSEKTVMLSVPVQCGDPAGKPGTTDNNPTGTTGGQGNQVDRCKVAYATLRAEGCRVRPLVIAVAILPNHCGGHHAGCGCDCCC